VFESKRVLSKSAVEFAGSLRLFTASLFTHAKEKASKASAKHAGVGVGFASETCKKNREAVDIFKKYLELFKEKSDGNMLNVF